MKAEKTKIAAGDLDLRVRARHLASGALDAKVVDRYLADLPDLEAQSETIDAPQPALGSEDD
jgi:hypothetical protein